MRDNRIFITDIGEGKYSQLLKRLEVNSRMARENRLDMVTFCKLMSKIYIEVNDRVDQEKYYCIYKKQIGG